MKFKNVLVVLIAGMLFLTAGLFFSACQKKDFLEPNASVLTTAVESDSSLHLANAQTSFASAQAINQRLGRGINIGNKFDLPEAEGKFDVSTYSLIAKKGFKHVRLAITWDIQNRSNPNFPYTIEPKFLATIKQQVDAALKNNLMVIVNMHHQNGAFDNPAAYKNRFIAEWKQIAEYFKGYPDGLVFELLNEPTKNLTPAIWNQYLADGLAEVRKSNPNRTVLIGTAYGGGIDGVKPLILPKNDKHLILTVHYYNPFKFTHQGADWVEGSNKWVGTTWSDTYYERGIAENEMGQLVDFSKKYDIPVHIGEFGVYNKTPMDYRIKWTRYMARLFEMKGFSWAYWQLDSAYGIFNYQTKQFDKPGLTNALLVDKLPPHDASRLQDVYKGDFSKGSGDWTLLKNDQSVSATSTTANSAVTIKIDNPGSADWHLQFRKPNISVGNKKKYLLSFKASSDISKEVAVSLQQNGGKWVVYAQVPLTLNAVSAKYYAILETDNVVNGNDPAASITFSLGAGSKATVTISGVTLQQFI